MLFRIGILLLLLLCRVPSFTARAHDDAQTIPFGDTNGMMSANNRHATKNPKEFCRWITTAHSVLQDIERQFLQERPTSYCNASAVSNLCFVNNDFPNCCAQCGQHQGREKAKIADWYLHAINASISLQMQAHHWKRMSCRNVGEKDRKRFRSEYLHLKKIAASKLQYTYDCLYAAVLTSKGSEPHVSWLCGVPPKPLEPLSALNPGMLLFVRWLKHSIRPRGPISTEPRCQNHSNYYTVLPLNEERIGYRIGLSHVPFGH